MRFAPNNRQAAFTLIEMILVVAIIGILAARLLPAISKAKPKAYQTRCLGNLKQVGLSFQLFANDHDGRFPMQVPSQEGGSAQYVFTTEAYRHFAAVSNDLSTTKILTCPSDDRTASADWSTFDNTHLSYFVGVDAKMSYPNSLLAGDRNISHNSMMHSNVLQTNYAVSVGWTTNLHVNKGNVLFSGGHVLKLDTEQLQQAFQGALVK